jgi:hypothetical protein
VGSNARSATVRTIGFLVLPSNSTEGAIRGAPVRTAYGTTATGAKREPSRLRRKRHEVLYTDGIGHHADSAPPGLPAGGHGVPCYVRAAVLGRGGNLRSHASAAVLAGAALLVAGCGGGGERQDARDSEATYRVEVVDASFPAKQELAEESELRITVRNDDDRTIPNVVATLEMARDGTRTAAFGLRSREPGLSSRSRPVWILEQGPLSGDSAYGNSWALGALPPGREKTFVWNVVAVEPGRYDLHYRLAGSLTGGARLETADGTAPSGDLPVYVDRRPGRIRVTAEGEIVRVPARDADRRAAARR